MSKKPGGRSSPSDCETCKERKYQDGSDENNVSFKTAAHISPESAASKVRAHENEHVSNAYKKHHRKMEKFSMLLLRFIQVSVQNVDALMYPVVLPTL